MSKQPIDILSAKAALDENYILVLTTNNTEREAVRAVLTDGAPAVIGRDTRGSRIGRLGGHFCIHLNGSAGAQGALGIGSLCRWMTRPPMPRPRIVVVVGFAWGNPNLTKQGDVIIASRVLDINHQRLRLGRSERRVASYESPIGSLEDCLSRLSAPLVGNRIIHGALASAELYVADNDERDAIIAQLPEILGGEMEAFDLVRDLDAPWLLVKAVCDSGGDDVEREYQAQAAQLAASVLPAVLELLNQEEVLEGPRHDAAANRLSAALIGQDIRISRPPGDRSEILRTMNNHVPRLIERLSVYSYENDEGGLFAETLAVAIVELAQNAFLHGDASYASCSFTETSVVVTDDGSAYDPNKLAGERGGARAWSELHELFLNTGHLTFSKAKQKERQNIYTFKLTMLSAEIRKAKRECRLVSSGIKQGPYTPSLSFSPACETLYYEGIDVFSFSRRIDDITQLIKLLDDGKGLFIACRNQRQLKFYSDELIDYVGPKLRIFIASRA